MQALIKLGISLDMALTAVRAGIAEAERLDLALSIAVVDESGILKASARMDGAKIVSQPLAEGKAQTAAITAADTGALFVAIKSDEALLQGMLTHPGLVLFAGGVPVVIDGQILGAVGVSGGPPADDAAVSRTAVAAAVPTL